MPKFQIVSKVEGTLVSEIFGAEVDVLAAFEIRGHEFIDCNTPSRLRAELQGQPRFSNLVGPMWGGLDDAGDAIIRYESSDANDTLSR